MDIIIPELPTARCTPSDRAQLEMQRVGSSGLQGLTPAQHPHGVDPLPSAAGGALQQAIAASRLAGGV